MDYENAAQELDNQDRYDDLVAQFERDGKCREDAQKMADIEFGMYQCACLSDGSVYRA